MQVSASLTRFGRVEGTSVPPVVVVSATPTVVLSATLGVGSVRLVVAVVRRVRVGVSAVAAVLPFGRYYLLALPAV